MPTYLTVDFFLRRQFPCSVHVFSGHVVCAEFRGGRVGQANGRALSRFVYGEDA